MIELINELKQLISFFDREDIPYMIFGGVANSIYGNPRQTFDVDIKIIMESEQDRTNFIDKIGSFSTIQSENPLQFIRETNVLPVEINNIRVDIVFAELPYEIEAVHRSSPKEIFGVMLKICQMEDLIIQKAISTREKDWLDIYTVIKLNKEKLDWSYLLKHCKELADFLADPSIYQRMLEQKNE